MAKTKIMNRTIDDISPLEVFPKFVTSQEAKGVSDKTVKTYQQLFHAIGKHIDFTISIRALTKADLDIV